jgi:hypothetical protein
MPLSNSTLRSSVEALGTLAKRLNATTDAANDTVQQVEQFLAGCSLGLDVMLHCPALDRGDEDGISSTTSLDYRRFPFHGGKYRIVVTVKGPDGKVEWWKPWSDCDRETKLEMFAYLPNLLTALAEKAREKIEANEKQTKATIETIKQMLPTG